MSHIHEAGQYLGIIRGAIHGKPYTEVTSVFAPSEYPKNYPPNPDAPKLFEQLKAVKKSSSEIYPPNFLPWTSEKADIHTLFGSLITFADDHDVALPMKYFPVLQINQLIEGVIDTSHLNKAPLGLTQQLNLALNISEGQLLAAAILCHSASRVVGRNRDQRLDPSFVFDSDKMNEWSASIARFDNPEQYDPPGDTYHFWATFSMGMLLRREFSQHRVTSMVYGFLFYQGADIMDASRKFIARNPLRYKHREVDRMGLRVGWNLGV